MVEAAEEIGAGHGAESQLVDRYARDQRRLGVDDGGFLGTQREAKGACDARRIEQRMNSQSIRGRIGLFDPELAEKRKFLARFVAAANREPASRHAERLAARPRAVEARALEDRHILEALVVGFEDAQTGKAEIAQNCRRLQLAEIEIGQFVDHPLRKTVLDDVDPDRRRIDESPMQRLEGKAEFLVAPDRRAGHARDRRILVEGEVGEEARQRRFGRLERFRGKIGRHAHDGVGGERNGLAERLGGSRSGGRPGKRSGERPAEGCLQEFATLPVRHRILHSFAAETEPRICNSMRRRSQPK